jgi:uncharacterized protein (TIGR03435 family)
MRLPAITLLLCISTIVRAAGLQAPALPASTDLSFEAVSIKVRTSGGNGPVSSPDRYDRSNTVLRDIIADAYNVQRFQVGDLPDWNGAVRFDIAAKAAFAPSAEQMRVMLQRMLADRFALRVHTEPREMPIYILRLARDDGRLGNHIKKTSVDCAAVEAERRQQGNATVRPQTVDGFPVCATAMTARPGPGAVTLLYRAGGVTSSQLADWLSSYVGRTVVDRTQLDGRFDIDLSFTPSGAPSTSVDDAVSVFTAVQEQLGLKLESTRGPVNVVVVDHVEHPTED